MRKALFLLLSIDMHLEGDGGSAPKVCPRCLK